MTDTDLLKLPKWAQQEIQRLRQDKAFLKEQIAQLNGTKPSDIQWTANYTEWHNIPTGAVIRIQSETGGYIEVLKTYKTKITISSSKILVVKPNAANSIQVESEDY